MAINREMEYVFKWGELKIDSANRATYAYLGGSPINITTSGSDTVVTGQISDTGNPYFAVAYHSMDEDYNLEEEATLLFAPAILTLEAETADVAYASYGKKPYITYGNRNYAVGDNLRPVNSTGTPAYACWTNLAYPDGSTLEHNVYFAKVIYVVGDIDNPTSLTILLGTFITIRS